MKKLIILFALILIFASGCKTSKYACLPNNRMKMIQTNKGIIHPYQKQYIRDSW